MSIAVVTDSTAYLPQEWQAAHGIRVVPLHVVIGGREHCEGVDVTPHDVAEALRTFTPVSTSRPSPQAFLEVYEAAIADGATEIVSLHLSAAMSSTIQSAHLAAQWVDVPVHVVDSEAMGMIMAYAAVSASELAAGGASGAVVAAAAERRCRASTAVFYVDTLEYLRRGGRIGAASALLGSALAIKPILGLRGGSIVPVAKVRTAAKALARLEEMGGAAAQSLPDGAVGVDVAVQHLDSSERARGLAGRLSDRLGAVLPGPVPVVELGAVVGAHVGPGTLAVTVTPRFPA